MDNDVTALVRRNTWLEESDRIKSAIISGLKVQVEIERQSHDRMKGERDMLVREMAARARWPGFR